MEGVWAWAWNIKSRADTAWNLARTREQAAGTAVRKEDTGTEWKGAAWKETWKGTNPMSPYGAAGRGDDLRLFRSSEVSGAGKSQRDGRL